MVMKSFENSIFSQFLFLVQQEMKHIDFNICVVFMGVLNGVANLYFYCYFGKLATGLPIFLPIFRLYFTLEMLLFI